MKKKKKSFRKGSNLGDEKSLGPGKLKKLGKGPEYKKKKFWVKTRTTKEKSSLPLETKIRLKTKQKSSQRFEGLSVADITAFHAQRSVKVREWAAVRNYGSEGPYSDRLPVA